MSKEYYEKLYTSSPNFFGEEAYTKQLLKLLSPGASILDLGAGQGRQAIPLARLGFKVRAIELSGAGVRQMKEVAQAEGMSNLTAEEGDVREGITGEYDAVISVFTFEHLTREEALKAIADMKDHTRPGGINMIATFLAKGQAYEDILKANKNRFYPEQFELKRLYHDWKIEWYKETEGALKVKNDDGSDIINWKATIWARKPV